MALAALAVAVWMVARGREQLESMWRLGFWRIAGLLGIFVCQFVVSVFPFRSILAQMGTPRIAPLEWVRIMFASSFGNFVFPQAGTAYRAVELKRRYGVPYTRYLHAYALFAWMATALNLALASVFSAAMLARGSAQERGLALSLIAVTACVWLAPFLLLPLLREMDLDIKWLVGIQSKLKDLLESVAEYGTKPRLVASIVAFGVARFVFWIAFFRVALSSIGGEVNLAQFALFLAIWQLSAIFVLTPGNLGLREVVYGVVGGAVGIGAAQGVVVSALIRAAQYLIVVPLGLLCGGWQVCRRRE